MARMRVQECIHTAILQQCLAQNKLLCHGQLLLVLLLPTVETQDIRQKLKSHVSLVIELGRDCWFLQKKMENREGKASAVKICVWNYRSKRVRSLVTHRQLVQCQDPLCFIYTADWQIKLWLIRKGLCKESIGSVLHRLTHLTRNHFW